MSLFRTTLALLLLTPLFASDNRPVSETLISHEWGTMTSVAGEDGRAVKWAPLLGPGDLPCFVNHLGSGRSPKYLSGFVRMETPVLYFYSPRPVTLSVGVKFPQGWITEWYPRATSVKPSSADSAFRNSLSNDGSPRYSGGEIRWDGVELWPGEELKYPLGKGESRYYAARNTDAAPLRIGGQQEKLIFYRGIGDFEVTVEPAFTKSGELRIRNTGAEPIPLAIVFENRGGRVGYRMIRGLQDSAEVQPPELTAKVEDLRRELADYLMEFGLYRKEALAMIETWRDSWFEEGTRVLYLMPRTQIDSLLPLEIEPTPNTLARVFVGRVEILSPWMRQKLETAAAGGDVAMLQKFGRFLGPFTAQIARTKSLPSLAIQKATDALVQQEFSGPACIQ